VVAQLGGLYGVLSGGAGIVQAPRFGVEDLLEQGVLEEVLPAVQAAAVAGVDRVFAQPAFVAARAVRRLAGGTTGNTLTCPSVKAEAALSLV